MIAVENATKRFGAIPALRGVSLRVAQGQKVALTGPNGSGKSTLLRLIVGLSRPSSGSISLDNRDPRRSKEAIGFAGHRPYLYPYLTAEENLHFYGRLYGVSDSRVLEVLEFMGLAHKGSALVRTFSKGEMQRLNIARAILHGPRFLILDEPFSGLDDKGTDQVLEYLAGSSVTTLLATHEPERARKVVDATLRLEKGLLR